MAAASNSNLPIASPQAQALSQQLAQLIQQKIKNAGGWITFAEFMQMALCTPGLGYYAGGAQKFGMEGDFVTAPEISPLFARTIARQCAQLQANIHAPSRAAVLKPAILDFNILELGAGTGKLAVDLLLELEHLNALPAQYFILEVSAHLRQVQRETCQKKLPKQLFDKIVWLETLPEKFNGLILANEVLDAIPAHILHKTSDGWRERGVAFTTEFVWLDNDLSQANLAEHLPQDLPVGYITEVNPAASALVCSLAECLDSGAILLIDYGFSAREYYHPQRSQGTLMCHYQQLAHDNPLTLIGLQDITAHVDFTSIAMLCEAHGYCLAGYVNQAQFLINCGMLDILAQHSPDSPQYMQLAAAAQKLLSPAEMGELFKVICLTKNIVETLIGFKSGDKSHTL